MREVWVVPDHHYQTSRDRISYFFSAYAYEADMRDGHNTPPWRDGRFLWDAEMSAQRVMATRVDHPSRVNMTSVLAQTFAAFNRAIEWAGRGGQLVVGLGHGVVGEGGHRYVSMAPLRFLRAHAAHFENVQRVFAGRAEEAELSQQSRMIYKVAQRVRETGIERIDFLSCNIGVGSSGRRLLGAAARAFGTEVRGLRGNLIVLFDNATGRSVAYVEPEGRRCRSPRRAGHPRAPFCTSYRRTVPSDPRLWMSANP